MTVDAETTTATPPNGLKGHVVLIDDDELFRESLEQNLRDSGYDVLTFDRGEPALAYFQGGHGADLVLLDWKMPEMNGIEVLRRLRQINQDMPVIFLTVLSDQIYEEAALLSGAVDFVEKSRSFTILLKRMALILGGAKTGPGNGQEGAAPASAAEKSGTVTIGPLELSIDSSRAFWKKTQVDLTLTEFEIVHYMATHAGQDVRYREIYDIVHGKGFVAGEGPEGFRANVRTFIKRIRQKFRTVDAGFEQIENYPGFGYRWREG
ncbi:MAG TPA: response regulator transcription factor [Alphaproteobacteria bacterium]